MSKPMKSSAATIFIVDDDKLGALSLKKIFESVNYHVEVYDNAENFLQAYDANKVGCLILDVRMPSITGLELQKILVKRGAHLPVIFVSAFVDITVVVRAMKMGALDFFLKTVNEQELLEAVNKAVQIDFKRIHADEKKEQVARRLKKLTAREHDVIQLMLQGKTGRQVAETLKISVKTVELHRINMMNKMGVRNIAALMHLILSGKPEMLEE